MYQVQFIATTSADWAEAIELIDAETNLALQVPDNAVFKLAIGDRCWGGSLDASTTDGEITRPEINVIQWRFTPDKINRYWRGSTHPVGLTMTTDGGTVQLMVGTLTILDGVVTP